MVLQARDESPGPGEVIVKVAWCGVCHTDLGFYYDSVPTRHAYPLTLGHEISGIVVETSPEASMWLGASVVVPAVIPCGECAACKAGRGQICPKQVFPGNDVHGGFGTHVRVPARGLCLVPDLTNPSINVAGLPLDALAVVADAVSTPFAAIMRAGLQAGDLAVWVGVGGVGGFGVQISAALGAAVIAIDVNNERLVEIEKYGADLTRTPKRSIPRHCGAGAHLPMRGKCLVAAEDSKRLGHPLVSLAFGSAGHGAVLSVVGYTATPVDVRLSNLMAFDAVAMGNWGCLTELYPAVV
jgi:6-hydroxycyclohex-1-ene-1-carbonyl-CoA dehydrogenase